MLKILYAASNNIGSKIQLSRFLKESYDKPYQIKIAAYIKSSPKNVSIDWTLDCLQNIFKPEHISLDNENFQTYFSQVKNYNPDLIISDLEYYSSYIANSLNISLWQCSSSLINFALDHNQKYNLGLFKQYYYLFHKVPLNNQRVINMIDNSNYNFVYSHLGDLNKPPLLDNKFQWIRPYHNVAKKSKIHEHNIVAASLNNNRKIIKLIQNQKDSIIFSQFCEEEYNNITLKDINNYQEYINNLGNSNLFVCEGNTSFLADAFYNGKYSVVVPDIEDTECIINSVYSESAGLSKTIHNEDLLNYLNIDIDIPIYNNDITFLHQRIDEI